MPTFFSVVYVKNSAKKGLEITQIGKSKYLKRIFEKNINLL